MVVTHTRKSGPQGSRPHQGEGGRAARQRSTVSGSRWSPIAPVRFIGRTNGCSLSPIFTSKKARAFAARGVLLPPYDTATTLARLALLIERYAPQLVIALGDSFHDGGGPSRMSDISRAALKVLQRGRDWIWIAGNHDPDPADGIGGRFADDAGARSVDVAPRAFDGGVRRRDRRPSSPARADCAARPRGKPALLCADGRRLVMPAFGAYTGGLNVRDRAIVAVFGALSFTAHMLGERRLFAVPAARCLSD